MAETRDDAPLVLLDGMSLAFRAFFALSTEIATSDGVVTNALHGFAAMLHSLIRSQRPRALAVAFDLPGGTFRDAMSEDYKGGRAQTPAELEPQFDFIRSLCEVLSIPVIGVAGYEADDVLATLATQARDDQQPVIIVTGDRDTFQLVEDPYVRVLYNRRGVSDYSLYDEAGIVERCGVEPARYPLLAALRGDPSDNLPGVPGIGEKTAARLLSQYRDFDVLFEHLDDLTPKLRENLAAFEDRARNNERVMLLVRDVPLSVRAEELTLGGWDRQAALTFFERFEMNTMRGRFDQLMTEGLLGASSDGGRTREAPPAMTLTDATSLESIVDEHRIVPLILRYREVEKLRSTYGATLIDTVAADGRIHATFQQTVARTGRLSSESPNLHNIPVRSAEGRRLRYAFLPSPGWLLAVADYNQIELRILAHLSQDEGLLGAFAANVDVHRAIASSVFGVPAEAVSHEQRELAKAVSYGLAYGMEAFGLSQRMGVTVSAAREVMDRYFASFPTLRQYMDNTVHEIRERGYSRTELGRIRPFPDLVTATGAQRQAAERQAMNAGIQGLAADVFKSALVRLDHALSDHLTARIVLQVHDEVVVEAPPNERDEVSSVIIDALTNAARLSVPLDISLHWGESWAAAKG